MKHALVTGGAGFIGSNLVDKLVDRGVEVEVWDCLSTGKKENVNPKATLRILKCQEELFAHKPFDVIFHLAAEARIQPSFYQPVMTCESNIIGTVNVLEIAKRMNAKLVYAGSSSFYHSPYVNPYSWSKWIGEEACKMYHAIWGLPCGIARFFNCYDNQTEVLTIDGYKLFKDLCRDDELATLNPKDHTIEYHKAVAWQQFDYDGNLLNFSSRSYDLCVTPDHRMYVGRSSQEGRKFQIISAQELLNSPNGYKNRVMCGGAKWVGDDIAEYVIPANYDRIGRIRGKEKVIKMEDWCEFLGWYITEGSAFVCGNNNAHRISISQFESVNKDNYYRIIELVRRMGFNVYLPKNKREIQITSVQLYTEIKKLLPRSGAKNKFIPAQIKKLDRKYLERLFESMMLGDGHKNGKRFTTISEKLMNDFSEICLKLGNSVTVLSRNGIYRLSVSMNNTPHLGSFYTRKVHCSLLPYNGKVYDVTVPNHIIYVRRNGKSCWSGNCYGPRQLEDGAYATVIGIFERQKRMNQPLTVTGTGENRRDFTHVVDIVEGLIGIAEHDSGKCDIYNLGTGRNYSINEVAALFMPDGIQYLPKRPGEADVTLADASLARERFGWEAKIKLEDYVNNFVQALDNLPT